MGVGFGLVKIGNSLFNTEDTESRRVLPVKLDGSLGIGQNGGTECTISVAVFIGAVRPNIFTVCKEVTYSPRFGDTIVDVTSVFKD